MKPNKEKFDDVDRMILTAIFLVFCFGAGFGLIIAKTFHLFP